MLLDLTHSKSYIYTPYMDYIQEQIKFIYLKNKEKRAATVVDTPYAERQFW